LSLVTGAKAQTPATQSAQQIRDAVQKKVQEQLANIKQAVSKKGFVGNITSKTDAGFVLTNLKNQSRTVNVAADGTIKLLNGKEGTLSDLKTNDFVLAMGDVDSQNKMTAKRLLVLKASEPDKRNAEFGTVTKTSTSTITIENLKKETWTLKTSSTTAVTTVTSGKVAKAKLADVTTGDKIVIVGTPATGQNTLTTLTVHILP
jgi:co-chaperonin GroES (HSP10)